MTEQPLTPRQVVDALVEMHSTFGQYNRGDRDPVLVPTTGGKLRAWPAALEAALAAYKREHLRAWLEERRVSIEAYRPPGATWESAVWEIDAPKALWAELATVQAAHPGGVCGGGFATADAARAAAAKALGYPGPETAAEEGPAPRRPSPPAARRVAARSG